jgi:hypothetical protein
MSERLTSVGAAIRLQRSICQPPNFKSCKGGGTEVTRQESYDGDILRGLQPSCENPWKGCLRRARLQWDGKAHAPTLHSVI